MRVYDERGRDFRHTPSQVGLLARGHIKDGEYYSTCLRCDIDHNKSHDVQHFADNNALSGGFVLEPSALTQYYPTLRINFCYY